MNIRRANNSDIEQIKLLFYNTITAINSTDYSKEQITIWASGYSNTTNWMERIKTQYFFVAEQDDKIIGFGSLTSDGCLDFLYTHKDFQKQGVATALLKKTEHAAEKLKLKEIWADVSITAKCFFTRNGFTTLRIYTKKVGTIDFENTIMIKKYC